MNIKKSLYCVSAAAGLAAALSAFTASAKLCPFGLPQPSGTGASCLSSNAHAFVRATVSTGATSNSWTYRLNYVAGPSDPKPTARLFNSDGVTPTKDLISGSNCVTATDNASNVDGNFGPAQVCVTKKAGQPLAPLTIQVFIAGA